MEYFYFDSCWPRGYSCAAVGRCAYCGSTGIVLSGSMEPTYHVGALIYVKKVDAMELRSGDVITFMLDEDTVATHRIVEVVPDAEDSSVLRFRTKGDADGNVDGSLVHYKNVLG
ncbi:MAG: signal peptidase I [Oscillospiraceae bacterium]